MFCFLWRRHQVSSSSASFPTFFYSKSSIWCFILETHCITLITMWACMRWDTLGYDYCWNSIMQTASPNPYFCISIIVIVTSWWKQLLHLSSAADLWWCVFTFMSWRSELSRHFLKKSFLFVEPSSSRFNCDWHDCFGAMTAVMWLAERVVNNHHTCWSIFTFTRPFCMSRCYTDMNQNNRFAWRRPHGPCACHLTLVVALARSK